MAEPIILTEMLTDLAQAGMPASNPESLPNIDTLLRLNQPRDGKLRFSATNKLVTAFREEFHYDSDKFYGGPEYMKALVCFELASRTLDPELKSAINQFASPSNYSDVRDCYRMRASRKVSGTELVKLAREVNAALIWRELSQN